jgi:hypothetical protein
MSSWILNEFPGGVLTFNYSEPDLFNGLVKYTVRLWYQSWCLHTSQYSMIRPTKTTTVLHMKIWKRVDLLATFLNSQKLLQLLSESIAYFEVNQLMA